MKTGLALRPVPLRLPVTSFAAAFVALLLLAGGAAAPADTLASIDFNLPIAGTTTEVTPWTAYDMTASGKQFGVHHAKDEGRFAYVSITGDFDIWCRIEAVQNDAGNLATAGLMARKSLNDDSEYVHIAANSHSPKWVGTKYGYDSFIFNVRGVAGGNLFKEGTFMYGCARNVNRPDDRRIAFPNCWVRLKRQGNTFRAWFAETAGEPAESGWIAHELKTAEGSWQGQRPPVIHDKDGAFPQTLYVGLALEANAEEYKDSRPVARARFREIHGLSPKAGGPAPARSSARSLAKAEANRLAEVTLRSEKTYADPFNEVTLDAVITDPNGRQFRVPAFWAGGNVWRVRYASPVTGLHRFRSTCSDTANAALHDVTGTIEVVPYTENNPLFRHGPVRVAEDRRHFAHADGTPFFWLGDTWWMGLVKRLHWKDEFAELTRDRREKGFTVIQLTAGLYGDLDQNFDERAEGDGGFPWTQDFTRIRPEYFDAADARVMHLVEEGLVPCVVGSWGYWLPWLGEARMQQHWRNLIARWGALPVVWCVAGETSMPWYLSSSQESDARSLRTGWTSIVRYVRQSDPFQRLVTTHPKHATLSRDEIEDPALLDFDLHQSGHSTRPEGQVKIALKGWNREPVMPSLSGEARYEKLTLKREWVSPAEGLPDRDGLAEIGTRQARQAFWAHLLASGCAGHTYGASGIFQINRDDWTFGKSFSGVDWGRLSWREAMNLPGSTHLAHANRLLLTLPWHRLTPAAQLAAGATAAAVTPDGRHALIFTANGTQFTVEKTRLGHDVTARWFDPTTGKETRLDPAPFRDSDQPQLKPPGLNGAGDPDWVLVLESNAAKP
jgi:hypothetical protein